MKWSETQRPPGAQAPQKVDPFLPIAEARGLLGRYAEAALPKPGFHEKDQVEGYLHDQVCSGKMALKDVQTAIATNWKQFLSNSAAYQISSSLEGNP